MAQWTFVDANGLGVAWDEEGSQVGVWDDGAVLLPGEEGFSRHAADVVAEHLASTTGSAVHACYAGTPNVPIVEIAVDQ